MTTSSMEQAGIAAADAPALTGLRAPRWRRSTTAPLTSQEKRSGFALAAIAVSAFVLGTAELVVVGVLDLVASTFQVSIGRAGLLVTAYAGGISVGGPILAALTLRVSRSNVVRAALALYLLGNLLAVVAASFELIIVARMITGALHGLFIGAAFAVATSLVPRERMGRAISAVFGGIAASAAVGVPLGTLVGQTFGWRATFGCVFVLGAVALAATLAFVPHLPPQRVGGARGQARHALAPRVLVLLLVGFLLLGGQFAGLTYLASYLADVTGVSGPVITIFLLCFGLANVVGTMIGGREADRDSSGTLVKGNLILVLALVALYVTGALPVVTAIALVIWGLVGFGLVPSLQHRVVSLAGPGAELAATLPASAVTAGIAVGSLAGGWVSASGGRAPIGLAALICAVALPVTWLSGRLRLPSASMDVKSTEARATANVDALVEVLARRGGRRTR
jgi:DHA1 family inner membrane transport protein